MTEFDPAQHRMVPQQRWFEDFTLGERFVIPSRTMTSIRTHREFAVACFDFTMPVGWMVSPGRTGLTHLVSSRR